MTIIKTENLLHEGAQNTHLVSPVSIGATTSPVENTNGLNTSWAVQIGKTGGERTEVVIGTPASGTSITHPALVHDHPADTEIFFIKYDKVVFERSTDGITGTASPMTNGTVTYQADSQFTQFDDTTASSAYGYRTYFRNSILTVNSTESDWQTFAGDSFYSLAGIRKRVKQRLWSSSYLDDETIDNLVNEWKFEMVNELTSINEDYSLGTVSIPFSSDGLGTITTEDFSQPRRVWVTFDGTNQYQSTKMDINQYTPDDVFTASNPHHAFLGDNIIQFQPKTAGTAEIAFYRFGTTMVNDTDELPLPMRPYTKSFVDYVEAIALMKDGKQSEYRDKLTEAVAGKRNFVSKLSPRDKSGPTTIEIVEATSGEDGFPFM